MIYYQWILGAYSHIAANILKKNLKLDEQEIQWKKSFDLVWQCLKDKDFAVLPIENSYAGTIHINIYNFLKYNYKIIWEIYLPINHFLLTKNKVDLKHIKKAYSHPQALSQCQLFLKKNNIEAIEYIDTSKSAEFVSKSKDDDIAAIASELAWKIYNLNVVEKNIQDQDWNTTRFLIVTKSLTKNTINYNLNYQNLQRKVSIIFKAKHIPVSLYKCLWAFATNNINLTKIESIPSYQDKFHYLFWLDFEWKLSDLQVKNALEELDFFTDEIQILWEYWVI